MATKRDIKAEITRDKILEASAEEIYRQGFRSASLSAILKKLGISKGALYHHFPDKLALGYAVLEECYAKALEDQWQAALSGADPIEGVLGLLKKQTLMSCQDTLSCGCPINNLATEMSPIDEGFRERVEGIYVRWHRQLTRAFLEAQDKGAMRADIDAAETAHFVIATMNGAIGLAKNSQDCRLFENSVKGLIRYLDGLRQAAA